MQNVSLSCTNPQFSLIVTSLYQRWKLDTENSSTNWFLYILDMKKSLRVLSMWRFLWQHNYTELSTEGRATQAG